MVHREETEWTRRRSGANRQLFERRAEQFGAGPDHAIAGVFVLAEIDFQRELLDPGHGHVAVFRLGVAAQIGAGEKLLAVGEHATSDATRASALFVESDECLKAIEL